MQAKLITVFLFFNWTIIYNCYASEPSFLESMYETLGQAKDTIKKTAKAVNTGLRTLVDAVKFMEHFIDSSIEEDCVFKCEKNFVAVPKATYEPSSNGCGSVGIYLKEYDLPQAAMVTCCDEHDICYASCTADKENCDNLFKKCLYKTCNPEVKRLELLEEKMCKAGAKFLYSATMTVGCSSFKDAQKEACDCLPINHTHQEEL